MRIAKRAFIAVAILVLGAVVLVGCGPQPYRPGGAPPPPPPAAAEFNDADVTFAQQMIPHHQMAIQMSEMAQDRSQDPRVKELAARIKSAQEPEVETMATWLRAWGKPLPTTGPGMMPHRPGMVSPEDMSRMMGMSGPQLDRMFLQMMIAHHQGAIDMARTEKAQGINPDARQLARNVETGQSAEIAEMQQMLATSTG